MSLTAQMVYFDGRFLPADQALFGLQNRAFRYGDALFETIRVMQGRPCFLPSHLERLQNGATQLGLNFSSKGLELVLTKLLESNGIQQGGRIRLTLFRKDGGFYTPLNEETGLAVEASAMHEPIFKLNPVGLRLGFCRNHELAHNLLSGLKSSNSLLYVLAGQFSKAQGWDDGLLFNDKGEVVEAVSSNLWVWKEGQAYTPKLDRGGIPGIMRKQLLANLRGSGTEVHEIGMTPETLLNAEEIWLTNSIQGLRWVEQLEHHKLGQKKALSLIASINEMALNSRKGLQGNWP